MTNGEKIKEIFPSIELYEKSHDAIQINFDSVWWNAEYKEPTTKNDLALIHTEGLDEEIRCTMCTNSMKSDRGCDGNCVVNKDMYKAVMDAIEKRIQPTTKNDLGVDCIDRQAAITFVCKNTEEILKDTMPLEVKLSDDYLYENVAKIMRNPKVLPPVTPIRPKGHWIYKQRLFDSCSAECSLCHERSDGYVIDNGFSLECKYYDFCPKCGSDNREVEE